MADEQQSTGVSVAMWLVVGFLAIVVIALLLSGSLFGGGDAGGDTRQDDGVEIQVPDGSETQQQ